MSLLSKEISSDNPANYELRGILHVTLKPAVNRDTRVWETQEMNLSPWKLHIPPSAGIYSQCCPWHTPTRNAQKHLSIYLLISIQASCGFDDHVAECKGTEEAKTGNNKPFFCWQRKGRKSLVGESDANISLKHHWRKARGF